MFQLVNTALPDLVLFVGEALVGNDAVDQLTKFNQALIDLSKDKNPRTIDGIILTKFDTIDDKVGAAISMVYSTGAPIVFLGVGQSYTVTFPPLLCLTYVGFTKDERRCGHRVSSERVVIDNKAFQVDLSRRHFL